MWKRPENSSLGACRVLRSASVSAIYFPQKKTLFISLADLKTICQFAQLEYKHGDPERGKTLFEGIVDSHPKRWDMWSIYMDMETTQRNVQGLRNLFDRVFTLKMTSHKAK